MNLNKNLTILEEYQSLENALVDVLKISKSAIKKSSLSKSFLNRSIKKNQSVQIPIDILNKGIVNPIYNGPIPETIFEDDLFLVLDKPEMVHSHPLSYSETDNILSYIRQHKNPKLLNINTSDNEKGLLYRLDHVTSGVIVYVKDETTLKFLRANYHSAVLQKEYHALVHGQLTTSGKIELYLNPSSEKGKKMMVSSIYSNEYLIATQEIDLISYDANKKISLVKINLNSGHRHQIRATLSFLGHPIVGDRLYGGQDSSRVWLHANRYEIKHDKIYSFRSLKTISQTLLP